MANTSAPFGFRQFGQREGTAPTAGFDRCFGLSSDPNVYYTGDLVAISSQSLSPGYITNASSVATSGVPVYGVFLGCEYYSPQAKQVVWDKYFPGNVGSSAPWNAYVCTNPEQLYIAQGTSAAVLGTSCIGYGINWTSSLAPSSAGTSGNTTSGLSVVSLQSTSVTGLSSTSYFKIVDIYQNYAPPGTNGTSSGSEGLQVLVVQPNNFARGTRTTATST